MNATAVGRAAEDYAGRLVGPAVEVGIAVRVGDAVCVGVATWIGVAVRIRVGVAISLWSGVVVASTTRAAGSEG